MIHKIQSMTGLVWLQNSYITGAITHITDINVVTGCFASSTSNWHIEKYETLSTLDEWKEILQTAFDHSGQIVLTIILLN